MSSKGEGWGQEEDFGRKLALINTIPHSKDPDEEPYYESPAYFWHLPFRYSDGTMLLMKIYLENGKKI